jgi:hypothetical protein
VLALVLVLVLVLVIAIVPLPVPVLAPVPVLPTDSQRLPRHQNPRSDRQTRASDLTDPNRGIPLNNSIPLHPIDRGTYGPYHDWHHPITSVISYCACPTIPSLFETNNLAPTPDSLPPITRSLTAL